MTEAPAPVAAVRFSSCAIEAIAQEVAAGGGDLETGGILLGHGREDFTVIVAGGPGPHAVRQPRFFLRDLDHAQRLAADAWDADGSQWIGDWHTHPCGPPHPSPADLRAVDEVLRDPALGLDAFLTVVVAWHVDVGWSVHSWRVRLLRNRLQVQALVIVVTDAPPTTNTQSATQDADSSTRHGPFAETST